MDQQVAIMKQRIHRDNMLFKWITENHEAVIGFKSINRNKCSKCGRPIPSGNNICDECFEKTKNISEK